MHLGKVGTARPRGMRRGFLRTGRAMAAHVMPALRGTDQVAPKDAERKGVASALAVLKGALQKVAVLTNVVLAVTVAGPMVLLPAARTVVADLAVPMVLAAVNVVRTLVAPAAWSSGWRRLTASSTKSSARLPL